MEAVVGPRDRIEELFARLSREPDFDAPELRAYDASDRLLLETAAERLGGEAPAAGTVVTIGDRHGALTLGAIAVLGATRVRAFQDPLLGERALAANAARLGHNGAYESRPLDASLLSRARLVLLQLPRSLAELTEIAEAIARWAAPEVVVLAGGRNKHMSRSMNEVLGGCFIEVTAGLGRGKSRVLEARGPRSSIESSFPVTARDPDVGFPISAFGSTFGGAKLDHGSRLLLRSLAEGGWPEVRRVVDLGCGNGVLAVSAACALPGAEVIATDQSAGAVAATGLTAASAGVADRVVVRQADATDGIENGWAELILLNPPFHSGATVHRDVAHRLIRSCARVLAPGGELRLVYNSHLRYRPLVERVIGPCQQLARDRTFTVLAARRGELGTTRDRSVQ